MQITCYTQGSVRTAQADEIHHLLQQADTVLWINIEKPDVERLDFLSDLFGLHPLAIEDVTNQEQRPKVDQFADYLFLILNPIHSLDDEDLFSELDVFIGSNYILTMHMKPESVIRIAQNRIGPARNTFMISPPFLLYTLTDTIVDSYMPVLTTIELELEELGDRLVEKPSQETLHRLMFLKRALSDIHWTVGPTRDVMRVLHTHESLFTDERSHYYLRDINDHLQQISDTLHAARESVPNLIGLHMNAVSNRLNVAVNRLTILTLIIGIFAGISGFYGMNFEQTWPPFDAPWGVPVVLLLMGVLISVVVWLVRRRGKAD